MPILALVIRAGTWRTAFIVVSAGLLLTSLVLARSIPQQQFNQQPTAAVGRPSAVMLPAMAAALIFSVGHQVVLVTFATWLENEHALSVSGLGVAALTVGGAELAASAAGIRLIDRMGKVAGFRRACLGLVPLGALLWVGQANLALALALLAAVFVFFEYAFISAMAVFTELDPTARGTSIGWGITAFGLGHAAGSVAGPFLFDNGGMVSAGLSVAACSAVSAGILFFMVQEPAT